MTRARVLLMVIVLGAPSIISRTEEAQAQDQRQHRIVPLGPMSQDVEVLHGDPESPGQPFVIRIRELPGGVIPPHRHPVDEHITVVQGTLYFAVGEKFDRAAAKELKAGGYAFIPKGTTMFGFTPDAAIVQVHGVGPFHIHWRAGDTWRNALKTLDDPDAGTIFKFRRGERVIAPRGSGCIRQGYDSGEIIGYEIDGDDGSLFIAEEREVRSAGAASTRQADRKQAHSHALGSVNFKNSGNDAAQPAFQRGVALLHSFEYEDAAEAFREAQKADAALAPAYWLEALTYSHVLWSEEKLEASRAVLNRLAPTTEARLAKAKTEFERGFGAAVEAFYAEASLPIRAVAFAESMTSLATRFPDDHEAAAFASLANMTAFFASPAAERVKYNQPVQQYALRVFRANSQHPGAAHYLIHFVDMNPRAAADALEFARAYDKIAPDAEHALHMPSHVFLPLGLWEDVIRSNERAWAAARRENLAKNASPADNSWHSLDWLHYAYLQLGRTGDALALIDTASTILRGVTIPDDNPDARNIVAWLAFRQGLETGKWDAYPGGFPTVDAAMKQPRPTPRAVSMATSAAYESAIVSLRGQNDTGPARKAIAAYRAEADSLPPNAPRRAVLHRLSTQLEAMIVQHEGNTSRAIALLQELAPTEPNNASLPPGIIPTYELLGDYLLAAGRKAEAADAYQKALDLRPNRSLAKRGLEAARK